MFSCEILLCFLRYQSEISLSLRKWSQRKTVYNNDCANSAGVLWTNTVNYYELHMCVTYTPRGFFIANEHLIILL